MVSKNRFEVVGLPVPVKELAIVSDSFHTKPLRQYLQSSDNFQVLGISFHNIQMWEGNRFYVAPVDFAPDFPTTIEQVLGDELTEKHLTVASYGGAGGSASGMRHGHGDKKDEMDKDAERFFRAISDIIYQSYSKAAGLPLVLAALPEHHNLFQNVSNNPLLVKDGVYINPKSVSREQLASMAWDVLQPTFKKRHERLIEKFNQAFSERKGDENLESIAKAAAEARVATLLVEADRIIHGRISDKKTGKTILSKDNIIEGDDLLDDIAELVSAMGGRVVITPREAMPTTTGIAAIFRY
jgi:hypothetical protein